MPRSAFTLTILGSGPAVPRPGGVNSGYLIQSGGSNVMLDCGSGTAGRLRLHLMPQDLDAIVVSHFHADHFFDVVPLYYALKFGARRTPVRGTQLPLYAPPGGRDRLRRFAEVQSGQAGMFEDMYDVREYAPGRDFHVGAFHFTFHPVQHYIPSHAMRIRADGRELVFSSDVGPCQALVDAARDASVLMCESTILAPKEDDPDPLRRGHSTAAEAGVMARQAGVRRLILTHYQGNGGGIEALHVPAAAREFGGPVELAEEGKVFQI